MGAKFRANRAVNSGLGRVRRGVGRQEVSWVLDSRNTLDFSPGIGQASLDLPHAGGHCVVDLSCPHGAALVVGAEGSVAGRGGSRDGGGRWRVCLGSLVHSVGIGWN